MGRRHRRHRSVPSPAVAASSTDAVTWSEASEGAREQRLGTIGSVVHLVGSEAYAGRPPGLLSLVSWSGLPRQSTRGAQAGLRCRLMRSRYPRGLTPYSRLKAVLSANGVL